MVAFAAIFPPVCWHFLWSSSPSRRQHGSPSFLISLTLNYKSEADINVFHCSQLPSKWYDVNAAFWWFMYGSAIINRPITIQQSCELWKNQQRSDSKHIFPQPDPLWLAVVPWMSVDSPNRMNQLVYFKAGRINKAATPLIQSSLVTTSPSFYCCRWRNSSLPLQSICFSLFCSLILRISHQNSHIHCKDGRSLKNVIRHKPPSYLETSNNSALL